jgi:hypothetical protein
MKRSGKTRRTAPSFSNKAHSNATRNAICGKIEVYRANIRDVQIL